MFSPVHAGVDLLLKVHNINEACFKALATLLNVMNDVTETWMASSWADAATNNFFLNFELFCNYECLWRINL